jgi:hypothetical protein
VWGDWAFIRFVVWISLPLSQRLKSTASNLWKCPPRLTARDRAVEVNGEVKVSGKGSTKRPRRHHRSMLAPTRTEWDQRNYIDCTDPWMNTATNTVLCHRGEINRCDRKSRQCASRKGERFGLSHVGVDAAVVIRVVVHVEQLHPWRAGDDRREGGEDRRVAPLTHIRNDFV